MGILDIWHLFCLIFGFVAIENAMNFTAQSPFIFIFGPLPFLFGFLACFDTDCGNRTRFWAWPDGNVYLHGFISHVRG